MAMALDGRAKLTEETGELQQVLGKLLAYPPGRPHPDGKGDLIKRLEEEIADVIASCSFVVFTHHLDQAAIQSRVEYKYRLYEKWHADPSN